MKKTNKLKWEDVRARLKEQFISIGITSCELKWEGCVGKMYPTFAHSLRRNDIGKYSGREHEEKMIEVIWACQPCHSKLDARKREDSYLIVTNVIKNRKKQINWEYDI